MIRNFNLQSWGKGVRKLNQRGTSRPGFLSGNCMPHPTADGGLITILHLQSTLGLREALRVPALPVTKGQILHDSICMKY